MVDGWLERRDDSIVFDDGSALKSIKVVSGVYGNPNEFKKKSLSCDVTSRDSTRFRKALIPTFMSHVKNVQSGNRAKCPATLLSSQP